MGKILKNNNKVSDNNYMTINIWWAYHNSNC